MTIRTQPWPAGVPSWADLSATDPAAAAEFYGAVLGWTSTDTGPEFGGYRMCQVEGHAVAGIGAMGPPAWTLYIATEDVEATVAAAVEAGGSVVLPPGDVGTSGRLAVVADPSGATVGLWQAVDHIGAGWVNEAGGMVWEDLRSADPVASKTFYEKVFGWRWEELFEGYGTVSNPGEGWPLGGLGPTWGQPPGWIVYFAVPDCDAAVTAAVGAGGAVVREAEDSPYGRMATVSDLDGVLFCVMTPAEGPVPPR